MERIAVLIYGDGGELGSFRVFAETLRKNLEKTYKIILVKYVNRDSAFFKTIKDIPVDQEIAELHVFSHSIGAGIFLGYKDPAVAMRRDQMYRMATAAKRKITYEEAVNTEIGAIQTDDFRLKGIVGQKAQLQKKFATDSFIKIWGCNSGIEGWVYSDNGIVDQADTTESYYWRAFNLRNTPKPSIARAFAEYFQRKVYGANSGANIEVRHKRKWISTTKYKTTVGHWPSGILPHRLVPEKGGYREYKP